MALSSEDVLIREATALDAEALAHVYVSSWRHAYRGIIDADYLGAMSVERHRAMHAAWFRAPAPASFKRVAVDAQARVIGFAHGGPARAPLGPAVRGSSDGPRAGPGQGCGTAGELGDGPSAGEVYVLYLLPEVHGRGIGTRLMRSMARGLDRRGYVGLIVWALARNPACAFYRRLGGQGVGSRRTRVGAQWLEEQAFAWADVHNSLLAERDPTPS